jgi:hypothetical protein
MWRRDKSNPFTRAKKKYSEERRDVIMELID